MGQNVPNVKTLTKMFDQYSLYNRHHKGLCLDAYVNRTRFIVVDLLEYDGTHVATCYGRF